jgi:hypothetical protein
MSSLLDPPALRDSPKPLGSNHQKGASRRPTMQLNAFYPTRDIGTDPTKVRD